MKICSGSPETSPDIFFAEELEDFTEIELDEFFTSLRELDELEAIHEELDDGATLDEVVTIHEELDDGATLDELFTSLREFEELEAIHADELDKFSDKASNALEESSPHAITKIRELKRANIRFIIVSLIAFYNRKYTITHPSSQHVYATKNLNF